ncbi:MAG: zinc ribbon domain-containing protein [Chloroflexi bacterium]|nr:zinc ribbon domain-containing protein [Chloroflexota bacterium]
MSAILIAILAVAAISIALYPLFEVQRRPARAPATIDSDLENLLSAREATYSAIKDLETDHAMGKLSDTDYATLRAKYEGKALTILQKLDAAQASVQHAQRAAASKGACAQCGTPVVAGAKFCRGCGAGVGAACGSCGAPVAADAKFCRRCGTPVAALQPA